MIILYVPKNYEKLSYPVFYR